MVHDLFHLNIISSRATSYGPDSKKTRRAKERMLKATMGKPTVQQASLERFIMSLDEDAR